MCEGRELRDCCENVFFKPAYVHAIRLFENAIQSMSAPTGALSGPDVFIPIFADVWKQLSAVAIAYFPPSGWWMWSNLSVSNVPWQWRIVHLWHRQNTHPRCEEEALQDSTNKRSLVAFDVYHKNI